MPRRVNTYTKLSELDFWQALSRNSHYRKDFEFRFGETFSAKNYLGDNRAQIDRIAEAMKPLGQAGLVAPAKIPAIINALKAGKDLAFQEAASLKGHFENGHVKCVRRNRYILVEIDLWAQRPRIEKQVWDLVRTLRKQTKAPTATLAKAYNDDIWQIYDAVRSGENVHRLAKQSISNSYPGTPVDPELIAAEDRKFRRHLQKAKAMIHQVYRRTTR